ncbi:MAG: TIGR03067 domain-containing protein, partial [Gemmataceae bacterium]
ALVEDGRSLSAKEIARDYSADGTLVVTGNAVSLLPPGGAERRQLVFTLDPKASPRAIDLAGATKVNSRGIYTLSGDNLVLCLGTAKEPGRPSEFTAAEGSNHVMMALQRVKPVAVKPAAAVSKPPPVSEDERIRKGLVGTWGHSTDSARSLVTFNADGTLSGTVDHTRGLRRLFDAKVRSSGTWRVSGGVVVVTLTSSTDANRRGQVYSYRVTHLGEGDLIAVDQSGATRREWRVR